MKKILSLVIVLVLSVSMVLSGCSTTEEYVTENDAALNESVVATVNGVNVTQADFNFIYKMMFDEMSQYAQYYGENWIEQPVDDEGTTVGSYIENSAIEQHKQLVAIEALAKEYEIDIDDIDDAVKEQKEKVVENYGGEEGYIEFLDSCRTTDKAIETYIRKTEIYNRVYEKITSEGGAAYINDEDVEEEFSQSYMTVQHILISTKEQTDEDGNTVPARSDEDAQALVSEILGKIEAGVEFDTLIDEYDEDPGMESGKYYTFTDGEMVAPFEEASKNLQVGEYTKEAVKTDYGYHIIKKYDINTEDEAFTNFKQQKANTKVNDVIAKKVETFKVTENKEAVEKYLESWVKELVAEVAEKLAADTGASASGAEVVESEVPAE